MGRLIAILLGGAALAFFVPALVGGPLEPVLAFWRRLVTEPVTDRILSAGPGVLAGLALVLLAIRSSERSAR